MSTCHFRTHISYLRAHERPACSLSRQLPFSRLPTLDFPLTSPQDSTTYPSQKSPSPSSSPPDAPPLPHPPSPTSSPLPPSHPPPPSPSLALPIDLHHNFHFLVLRQFRIERRPAHRPQSPSMPQHLPQLFRQCGVIGAIINTRISSTSFFTSGAHSHPPHTPHSSIP